MSGPALSEEALEARRAAQADADEFEEATRDIVRAERRRARIGEVAFALTPFNTSVTHARPGFKKRRAAAKRAKQARKRNRG
jgi:hypothetical protein